MLGGQKFSGVDMTLPSCCFHFQPHGSVMDVEEAYEEMLQQERQQVALQKTATPGGSTANESSTAAAGSSSDESSPRQLPRGTQSKSADMASPPMSSTGFSPHGTQQAKMGSSQVHSKI